MLTLDPQPGSL